MTIGVVNGLELVDVNEEDGESPTVPFCLAEPVVETLFKGDTVGKTRECVLTCNLLRFLAQRFLR